MTTQSQHHRVTEPKEYTILIPKTCYSCHYEYHRHKTYDVAQKCIDKAETASSAGIQLTPEQHWSRCIDVIDAVIAGAKQKDIAKVYGVTSNGVRLWVRKVVHRSMSYYNFRPGEFDSIRDEVSEKITGMWNTKELHDNPALAKAYIAPVRDSKGRRFWMPSKEEEEAIRKKTRADFAKKRKEEKERLAALPKQPKTKYGSIKFI